MNLKQMQYFLTIADEGSISRAARVLHISQPPLSQQLRRLEEELRVRLFIRGARTMRLTDAGQVLYQHVQNILELSERAVKDLQQFGDEERGSLRIGMASSSAVPYVLERIRPFRKKYPRMGFRIYEGNTYQLLDRMREDKIELAFVRTPFAESEFECLFLKEETMAAVGRQNFFRNGAASQITLQELSEMPLIVYRRWITVLDRSFEEAGISAPEYFCVCDDMRTSLAWAENGFGVAVVPASYCAAAGEAELLTPVLADSGIRTRITLIWKKERELSKGAKNFLNCFAGREMKSCRQEKRIDNFPG